MALTKRDILAAPLVRKTRKKTTQVGLAGYQPASVIPGIPHTIEGMPTSATYTRTVYPQGAGRENLLTNAYTDAEGRPTKANRERSKQREKISLFQQKQEARKRIAPIADPEAGKAERERRAARRRKRGRLGTMLSERERLG